MVISKYRPSQIILVFILAAGLISCVFVLKDKFPMAAVFMLFSSIGILFITFFKSPIIEFDDLSITRKRFFQSSVHTWDDVESVYLSVKEDYSILLFGWPMEAMRLIFNDGTKLVVWEQMYKNMPQMRSLISEKLNGRLHFIIPPNKRNIQLTIVEKKYKGNVFTSFNTLLIIGMIVFFVVQLKIRSGKESLLLIPFFFIIFLYIANGFQMNFFEIKFDLLIIRNQYFPWKITEYGLADIEEVSKEKPHRRSDGLRIITYDFQSKFYGAGSLRRHHWEELFNDLKSLGIKISD